MSFIIATLTASFRAAELSEDRLAVHHVAGGIVVVVADGAGGQPGGGPAADLAVRLVGEALTRARFNAFTPRSWGDLLVEADVLIEHDRVAGETTCVVVAIADDGRVMGASCGDSGALIVRPDGMVDDLTIDQKRKLRLGSGRAVPVAFGRPILEGTLVVASDGLMAYARTDVVGEVVLGAGDDLGELAHQLVDRVRLPSGDLTDDVAIVVVARRPG